MAFIHDTVLLDETVDLLNVRKGKTYMDCTMGGCGHTKKILDKLEGTGLVIGVDQDEKAIKNAEGLLEEYKNFKAVRNNFRNMDSVLKELDIEKADGIVFDLGVSSPQLDEGERGFSYQYDAPLDMRMDRRKELTAEILVNEGSAEELARIIRAYGEERWADRIAEFIVNERKTKRIVTTSDLVDVIKKAIPAGARKDGPHPGRKTFQALRIAVNDEMGAIEEALDKAIDLLAPGGRVAVITFHSLEDRIVKEKFKNEAKGCTCPPEFPVCVCGKKPKIKIITKKPVIADENELSRNRRARSAKLRVAERVE